MTDPERWRHAQGLADDVRALLDAGEAPPAMPASERRRGELFTTRLVAGLAMTSLLLSSKVVAALLVVSVGGVATWQVVERVSRFESAPAERDSASEPARRVRSSSRRARAPGAPPVELPDAEPPAERLPDASPLVRAPGSSPRAPALSAEPLAHSVARASATVRRAARTHLDRRADTAMPTAHGAPVEPTAAPSSEPAPVDRLASEATLLEEARARLTSDPASALAVADLHGRRYARGLLAAERELVAIDALVRLGRSREAEERARALVSSDPQGMYVRRVQRLLPRLATDGRSH